MLSELIDKNLGVWNKELIYDRFAADEAKKIVNNLLSRLQFEDKLIWNHEKSGEFSVRSVYHASVLHKDIHKPCPSCITNHKLWQEIWRAPILNRTRNFLWKVTKNILPSKVNLNRKGIGIDLVCPLCSDANESTHHLFMECFFVRQAIFSFPLCYRIPTNLGFNA